MEADLIVSCPYNPAHRIRKYKLMSHISKCKKTSKMIDKTECPLDKTHIIDRDCLKVNKFVCNMVCVHTYVYILCTRYLGIHV